MDNSGSRNETRTGYSASAEAAKIGNSDSGVTTGMGNSDSENKTSPPPFDPQHSTGVHIPEKTDTFQAVTGRNISALLNPRPVVLIGSHYEDEVDFATVAWISPLSHTPPLFAFALRKSSRTYQLIEKSKLCSVCVPDASLLELVRFCGNSSGNTDNKAEHIPFRMLKELDQEAVQARNELGLVPVIDQARSILVGQVFSITETGDHMHLCASVEAAYSRETLDEKGRLISVDTLLCVQHDVFAAAHSI